MPANKFASHYLNEAYERMLAAVQAAEPPAFNVYPSSDDFQAAADHLRSKFVSAIDDYIYAISVDAATNAASHISSKDYATVLSAALDNSGLMDDLEHEAYEIEENREVA